MKTRQIASFVGIAAIASAVELGATEVTHVTGGSPGVEVPGPIGILIMAAGRSGSSMVGEFFLHSEVRRMYRDSHKLSYGAACCLLNKARPNAKPKAVF